MIAFNRLSQPDDEPVGDPVAMLTLELRAHVAALPASVLKKTLVTVAGDPDYIKSVHAPEEVVCLFPLLVLALHSPGWDQASDYMRRLGPKLEDMVKRCGKISGDDYPMRFKTTDYAHDLEALCAEFFKIIAAADEFSRWFRSLARGGKSNYPSVGKHMEELDSEQKQFLSLSDVVQGLVDRILGV